MNTKFRINSMNLRDADTGKLVWDSGDWAALQANAQGIVEAHVPKSVLKCKAVARELDFTSEDLIDQLRVEQRVLVHGDSVEDWNFSFGFVIPGSTNTWQTVLSAAEESEMIPAEILSGNTIIETAFFDGDKAICRLSVRVYYE
ncbi:delta subunit of GMP phosphodiesterase [Polychytrium aggregatum]|uniref:delta subunit of GMP phosphodiesterase n=1 Tax=Polychytrium aggregatum TaxID=110093 RepID=UPI0022FE8C31|nr:delta subunit of GMP phosphodiesterase [Polychytrium aggregatum]KAI9204589.1 delta subunit of GMP phosphodiesterase [Polychytrium aggregatum]